MPRLLSRLLPPLTRSRRSRRTRLRRSFAARGTALTLEPLEVRRMLAHDAFEANESIATATVLGSVPEITLRDLTIHDEDDDFFELRAHETGKLVVNLFFTDPDGNLDLDIHDRFGSTIASSLSTTSDEHLVIPVVAQETYYVHVFGFEEATNEYDLEIENFAAPVPDAVVLHPDDDTGISATDNITDQYDPRIIIQADLLDFADEDHNGIIESDEIQVLTAAEAEAEESPGAAVEVFVNGISQGFADAVGPSATLFEFRLSSAALETGVPETGGWLNFVTAAVRIFDNQQQIIIEVTDPASDRTPLSDPLLLHYVDSHGPRVTDIGIADHSYYNLFDPSSGPTPPITTLAIELEDPPARDGFVHPFLAGAPVDEIEPNSSINTAQDIDEYFSLTFDETIASSLTVPHASILGTGSGSFDYYQFTITNASDRAEFDIDDANFSTEIFLYDLAGNLIDEAFSTLSHTFTAEGPGTYVIGVAEFDSDGDPGGITGSPPDPGDFYTLHVSIENHDAQLRPDMVRIVGDAGGIIPIEWISLEADELEEGESATGTLFVQFAEPLPDDRYTFTLFDEIVDPPGNALDGESNGVEPHYYPNLPSGNGTPGGDFVARFTVDSRPEIGVYAADVVWSDMNGNFIYDPNNTDFTNRDQEFLFGGPSDQRFAGKLNVFAPMAVEEFVVSPFYDVLAAYGYVDGTFRFLIDLNANGAVDAGETVVSPLQINGLAVAGNFDEFSGNGDELGIFDGQTWYLDVFGTPTIVDAGIRGYPIVGDFDGDGLDDLGTYQNNVFYFNLAHDGFADPVDDMIQFGAPGVLERPVAADMNIDGIDDIGLWVPSPSTPVDVGQWHFLLSEAQNGFDLETIFHNVDSLDHPFSPAPLGSDLFADFGNPIALPIVGNFSAVPLFDNGDDNGDFVDESPDDEASDQVTTIVKSIRPQPLPPLASETSAADEDAGQSDSSSIGSATTFLSRTPPTYELLPVMGPQPFVAAAAAPSATPSGQLLDLVEQAVEEIADESDEALFSPIDSPEVSASQMWVADRLAWQRAVDQAVGDAATSDGFLPRADEDPLFLDPFRFTLKQ